MRNPLHSICPYFAMFPEAFVEEQVERHTEPYDVVLDPFSGRGTTVFQSLLMNRAGLGSDINPVAYCISSAKAELPPLEQLIERIDALEEEFDTASTEALEKERQGLPPFFRRAFYHTTLREIIFLRQQLMWRDATVDRFVATLVLSCLHGEMKKTPWCLSNQMPRTISTKPGYSHRYWKEHNLWPKKRDTFRVLRRWARYRFRDELPNIRGRTAMVDARECADAFEDLHETVRLIVTSPPYFDVTNYEEDQWLRLWFLGHPPHPTYKEVSSDDRHLNKDAYWKFLAAAWQGIAPLLQDEAIIVCRLGGRGLATKELVHGFHESLNNTFDNAQPFQKKERSQILNRQTGQFQPGTVGCKFEVDFTYVIG